MNLPDRMDAAADTLCEATIRYDNPSMNPEPQYQDWRAVNLRSVAAMWRIEDEARETLAYELAKVMHDAGAGNPAFPLHGVADVLLKIYDITPKVRTEGAER